MTSDEGPWGSARGSPRPSRAGFKAGCANRRATSVVNFSRGSASQPGMRSVAVVPGEVQRQLLLEPGEAIRDEYQPSRTLGFERSHASLDYSQTPMLVERSEAELNSPTPAPPSKSLRKELLAPVGNEVPGCLSRVTKKPLKEAPNRRRRGLRAIDRESHQSPGEMIDDRRCPPTEWPDLRQGEGEPGDPEA